MNKDINPIIYEKLREQNINEAFDENEAILYLLSIYFELPVLCFIETIIRKVNLTKIVDRDYETNSPNTLVNPVTWNIQLFIKEEVVDVNWSWVDKEYRPLFKELKTGSGGDSSGCIAKMKKFFSLHPEVRKEEVIMAAKLYLEPFRQNAQNVKYIQGADYFISKVVEGTKKSRLEQFLEQAKEMVKKDTGNNIRTQVLR